MENELITPDWMPRIDQSVCTGCGDCIAICPPGALGWHSDRAALLYPQLCTYCAACEQICPAGAIELPYLVVNAKELSDE